MKIIDLGSDGELPETGTQKSWAELRLGHPWGEIVELLAPASTPSEIQALAIQEGGLLHSRRNLVISGPTNSGKSLLSYLALINGVRSGKRVLLLEPLRAIAQEKFEELERVTREMAPHLGRKVGVEITTGDYRLHAETLQSPPPEHGEIVIATPERIEAILRNPDNDHWINSFSVVCVDEAHLLADQHRGACLEYVITSFRLIEFPPRFLLLSATLGNPQSLSQWLEPCDFVQSTRRRPPVTRSIYALAEEDDPKQRLFEICREILATPSHSLIVFVYQRAWTSTLTAELNQVLSELCGKTGARAYHSSLSSGTKSEIRAHFLSGDCRCIVTTAALAMGVNLPATHVIVRDLQYGPGSPIGVGGLLQISGRAGRGTTPGHAIFVWKPGDAWELTDLESQIESPRIPNIESVLSRKNGTSADEPALAELILSLLSRRYAEGMTVAELRAFVSSSLVGQSVSLELEESLKWLSVGSRGFAYKQDQRWKATRLGESVIRASLSLNLAAGFAQLIRDFLSVDEADRTLLDWSVLDVLLLVEILAKRAGPKKTFSEDLAAQVDAATEQMSVKSVVFQNWIKGAKGFSKAIELIGSIGLSLEANTPKPERARQLGYMAMWRALVLWKRANGVRSEDLERQWKIRDLTELEESWRDDRLFMLGALSSVWDIRCFFYHLKEECAAEPLRLRRVKRAMQRLRILHLQVMNLVSWCSPLGPMFLRIRGTAAKSSRQSPAKATMRRLEDAGINSPSQLLTKTIDDFHQMGIRRDLAEAIVAFVRRR